MLSTNTSKRTHVDDLVRLTLALAGVFAEPALLSARAQPTPDDRQRHSRQRRPSTTELTRHEQRTVRRARGEDDKIVSIRGIRLTLGRHGDADVVERDRGGRHGRTQRHHVLRPDRLPDRHDQAVVALFVDEDPPVEHLQLGDDVGPQPIFEQLESRG